MGYTALAEAQGLATPAAQTVTGADVERLTPPLPALPVAVPDGVSVEQLGHVGWLFTHPTPSLTEAVPAPVGKQQRRRSDGRLTAQQTAILQAIADGAGHNDDIAARLSIAPNTVKTHLRGAFRRLGAADRAHAVILALRAGAIT